MDTTEQPLSLTIRELRLSLGETQKLFAKRLHVTETSVLNYESGVRPKASVLKALSEIARNNGLLDIADVLHQAHLERAEEAQRIRKENQRAILARRLSELKQSAAPATKDETSDDSAAVWIEAIINDNEYPHRALWRSLTQEIEKAKNAPKTKSYQYVVAPLMGYLVLEAYVTYAAEVLKSQLHTSDQERGLSSPHVATMSKLKELARFSDIPESKTHYRPFATVIHMADLRDKIVHEKDRTNDYFSVEGNPSFRPTLRQLVESKVDERHAELMIFDLRTFIEQLHASLRAKAGDVLTPFALDDKLVSSAYSKGNDKGSITF